MSFHRKNCKCCCTDPTLDLTLSWTDADATKSYLGLTWTNGETKGLCPTLYVCTARNTTITGTLPTPLQASERWSFFNTANQFLNLRAQMRHVNWNGPSPPAARISAAFQREAELRGIGSARRDFSIQSTQRSIGSGVTYNAVLQDIAAYTSMTTGQWIGPTPWQNYGHWLGATWSNSGHHIQGEWMGSVTDAAGITYSWAKTPGSSWGC